MTEVKDCGCIYYDGGECFCAGECLCHVCGDE